MLRVAEMVIKRVQEKIIKFCQETKMIKQKDLYISISVKWWT